MGRDKAGAEGRQQQQFRGRKPTGMFLRKWTVVAAVLMEDRTHRKPQVGVGSDG